jgi:hypothetical protein
MEAFVAGVELWQKFLLVLEPIRVFFGSNGGQLTKRKKSYAEAGF